MYIDCHVHCRDEEQSYKETIAHALEVARDSGIDAIFDMPNPFRPVFNEQRVKERLALAQQANVHGVLYKVFLGLTKNREQIKRAVEIYDTFFPKVIGMKLYAGHSTGELGVIGVEDQATVYLTLSQERYNGVLFVHAEKEKEMNEHIGAKFNPSIPISHCLSRPWRAEVESIKDQINLAKQYNFKGKLHIAHISHPKSVDLVFEARKELDISCGVCPHHLFYDWNQMFTEQGIMWKMNPPLRSPGTNLSMIEYLRHGKIDWIESDHAPHDPQKDKLKHPFASGITGLAHWPLFAELLRYNNFSEEKIRNVTFDNIANRFGIDIKHTSRPIKDRRNDYPFNFYTSLEKKIEWKGN